MSLTKQFIALVLGAFITACAVQKEADPLAINKPGDGDGQQTIFQYDTGNRPTHGSPTTFTVASPGGCTAAYSKSGGSRYEDENLSKRIAKILKQSDPEKISQDLAGLVNEIDEINVVCPDSVEVPPTDEPQKYLAVKKGPGCDIADTKIYIASDKRIVEITMIGRPGEEDFKAFIRWAYEDGPPSLESAQQYPKLCDVSTGPR